jgi:Na+-transporting NADH:ubiquinone oxidoreductase subunit C
MKLDTNSNLYTIIYSTILVVVVAAGLAFTAVQLQPAQDANIRIEKMQNILQSIGIETTPANAEETYSKYIVKQYAVNTKGEVVIEGKDAAQKKQVFELNLKVEGKNIFEKKEATLPIYEAKMDDGIVKTIIPLRGKGLWGPIWGYLSLKDDFNTISGAVFDHKGETPGLGAEINTDWFEKQFLGKTLFEGSKMVSITAHKGGKGAAVAAGDTHHGVDAISGGTITSKGLEAMMKDDWLFAYKAFFEKNKK